MAPSKLFTHHHLLLTLVLTVSNAGAFQLFPSHGLKHRSSPMVPLKSWKPAPSKPSFHSNIIFQNNYHHVVSNNGRLQNPLRLSSSASYDDENKTIDSLVYKASTRLRGAGWLSWWSQLILTVVSSVTFVFARNVMDMQAVSPLEFSRVASKFILPGAGIVTSIMSIIWTWGGRRLSRRFIRRSPSRVEAANLLRRVINVGVTLNLIGLFVSLLGAQYIVGTLVAKAMQNVVGFGAGAMGGISSQVLQPLDVLVVQANTNILLSHFISLACLLWLTRTVDVLDPPSLEDDE